MYTRNKSIAVYQWKVQVSQKFPEVPDCAQSHQKDDKQTHKLHPESPSKIDAAQQEPEPPGGRKRTKNTDQNESIIFLFIKHLDRKISIFSLPQIKHRT